MVKITSMEEKKSQEEIIAENLVYYRKAAGLTQLEIADKFNYSSYFLFLILFKFVSKDSKE